MAGFTFPEALLDRYRIEQVTDADRAAILGGNYARISGLDVEKRLAATADDEFSVARAAGRAPMWSHWRADAARPASDGLVRA